MYYRPKKVFRTPLILLIPEKKKVQGVTTKQFPAPENGLLFYGSFATYGGTEREVNDVYSIMDTAKIMTWYRPDIQSDCRVVRASDNAVYEIIGEPENMQEDNLYMKFTVKRVKGGV